MSKTLIIHPQDESTAFLSDIYKDLDCDVISDCDISKEQLVEEIKNHDKIIMMGHGNSFGLFNPQNMTFLIDDSFGGLLREKETITIWCFSDGYARRHHLKGFHTGMIISEVEEEYWALGNEYLNKFEILANMKRFAKAIKECINELPEKMVEYVLGNYTGEDKVTIFNRKNIFNFTSFF